MLIVVLTPFLVECYIRKQVVVGFEETWVASVASYWGGIIGGLISGLLACIGVVATIRYYKESDAKKERAEIMPFFIGWEEEQDLVDYVYLPRDAKNGWTGKGNICIGVKNIGNGFAQIEDVRCKGDISESTMGKTVIKESGLHLFLLTKDKNNVDETIEIHFLDALGNKYIQSLRIYGTEGDIKLSNQYPQIER